MYTYADTLGWGEFWHIVAGAVIAGGALTALLIIDDCTGFGAIDDPLIAASTACFVSGLDGMMGKKVCSVCGEVQYGCY